MEIKDRIKLIMDSHGMSQKDFAAKLQIAQGSLCGILTDRTKPTNNTTMAIHSAFPEISINWLLFGEGEMYTTSASGADGFQRGSESPELFSFSHDEQNTFHTQHVKKVTPESSVLSFGTGVHSTPVTAPKVEQKPPRKIIEIRVFFDDGTFETFTK